jgi:hypothetical protein
MTGVRLLDGIHAECPDSIDGEGLNVRHAGKIEPVICFNK